MSDARLGPRLRRLPVVTVQGREFRLAHGPRARLIGLAALDRAEAGAGLLIPGCRSVHTFGMRFALDLCFLGAAGEVVDLRQAVPPRRLAYCAGARAVLELPAGEGGEFAARLA